MPGTLSRSRPSCSRDLLFQPSPGANEEANTCNRIGQIYNQQPGLIQLPTEVKQQIAFELNVESYNNLRLTSKQMSNSLIPVNNMLVCLKNGCSGHLRKKYESLIFENKIRAELSDEKNRIVTHALKYILSRQQMNIIDILAINMIDVRAMITPNPGLKSNESTLQATCSQEVYDIFVRYIHEVKNKNTHDSTGNVDILHLTDPYCRSLHLLFYTVPLTHESLHNIFEVFDRFFHQEKNGLRLMMATCAARLKECLYAFPPPSFSREDIIHCTSKYPALFAAEKIIADHLAKNETTDAMENVIFYYPT